MNLVASKQIESFLIEDIGTGDLSTELIFNNESESRGYFMAKDDGVIAGLAVPDQVYQLLNHKVSFRPFYKDGDFVKAGDIIGEATGPIHALLTGERVILNLMQRMSGIATQTSEAIKLLDDPLIRICDTRKTAPGLRFFDKLAVRIGGGYNHRMGLYDGVMLKDNHIAFAGGIEAAVAQARNKLGHTIKVEVEVETKAQLIEALKAEVDIIMFDNRSPEEVKLWVKQVPSSIITEVSGGITLEHLERYRHTGVDYISIGALTHSVKAFDISFNSKE
ncbi:MAG: carboxylating nicotinate-nucleotide diphosphorylase [Streptococcaceae bacterium]|jgi:nicotinate-nucleotide pyrophosphorylase (carboxylating)|nr:carboxylating nicotinate-nucleotide diphosphorylase [Streptococcaceae bacterium]MCH4176714.1 carboxylating nicotinate-nucleotide diphosphorylase [Streptococcaceae bacterium]